MDNNIEVDENDEYELTDDMMGAPNKPATPTSQPKKCVIKKKCSERSTMTSASIPNRSRAIQTVAETADVGVQCKRDDSEERVLSPKNMAQPQGDPVDCTKEERKFLCYVSQQTNIYPNGMLECRVCGEIAECLQKHQNHVELHYGPRALCPNCGEMVDHELLISKHNYSCSARPNARFRPEMYMQCPQIRCDIIITSKQQLAKHLNTHFHGRPNHCLHCRKSFVSISHFLSHRLQNADCRRAKLIYLPRNNPRFHGLKRNPKRCTICMKQFSNARRCVWHKRRCIVAYRKRLEKLIG